MVVQWAKNPSVGLVGVITSSLSDVQSGLELPFLLVLGDVMEEYLQMLSFRCHMSFARFESFRTTSMNIPYPEELRLDSEVVRLP